MEMESAIEEPLQPQVLEIRAEMKLPIPRVQILWLIIIVVFAASIFPRTIDLGFLILALLLLLILGMPRTLLTLIFRVKGTDPVWLRQEAGSLILKTMGG